MMYRVEDKFMCTRQELLILQTRLQAVLDLDSNQDNESGYKVTSVYFDDRHDTSLRDTVDGKRNRKKFRIRIYNASYDTIKLEVKCKRDSKVYKYSERISFGEMQNLLEGQCIKDDRFSLDSAVTLFNLEMARNALVPKVIVEYDRRAYVYGPGNVRITFDRNVRASDDIDGFANCGGVQYTYLDGTDDVLEVKYDEFLPGFIARLLELGNMRQVSYSKYRLSRELIGE